MELLGRQGHLYLHRALVKVDADGTGLACDCRAVTLMITVRPKWVIGGDLCNE